MEGGVFQFYSSVNSVKKSHFLKGTKLLPEASTKSFMTYERVLNKRYDKNY